MTKRNHIDKKQEAEIAAARRTNKDKNVEKRLKALSLRAEGKKYKEIGEATGFHPTYASKLVTIYCENGISAIVENHQTGNNRNMSIAEEAAFLSQFKEKAEQGQIIETREIENAYKDLVGHTIGGSQIYNVLRRHGWRKLAPRSKHPNKASDEVIEASKKLT